MATLHVFFLVCAGAVFMASAVESTHPLRLNKRQSSNINRCLVEFTEEICTSGYSQDRLDLAVRCNHCTAEVMNSCGRNANGMLCGAIDSDAIRDSARSIGCDFSSTTCTPECRTRLMSIRDELDCCFSFFNDSSSGSFDPILFDNRLWTSCGVQGSSQACLNNTLQLNEIPVDPTCDLSVFECESFFNINCRREYIVPLIARVSAVQNCEDYVTEGSYVSCNINRFGTICDYIMSSDISNNYTAANTHCSNTSTCNPLCIEALNNISMTSGCCFNEEYNDTNQRPDWLSDEFYSMCGLESPGLCGLGISNPNVSCPASPQNPMTTGNGNPGNTEKPTNTVPTSAAQTIVTSSITMTIITLLSFVVQ